MEFWQKTSGNTLKMTRRFVLTTKPDKVVWSLLSVGEGSRGKGEIQVLTIVCVTDTCILMPVPSTAIVRPLLLKAP